MNAIRWLETTHSFDIPSITTTFEIRKGPCSSNLVEEIPVILYYLVDSASSKVVDRRVNTEDVIQYLLEDRRTPMHTIRTRS